MVQREFDDKIHLGFLFDCASREIRNAVSRGVIDTSQGQCTMKHGWLLGYLERQEGPIFQKDLEKVFHFPKSSLADMIQYLEKAGYIEKVSVDSDARKKQIVVTEEGRKFTAFAEAQIMEVDDYITQGIPQEQIEMLLDVLEKLRKNAAEYKSYVKLQKEE
ncbi:DNA-binding transcriptional regulator, MarR family [Pseudobutyrivibrio sp. YE44]|uniref:MarR family winged helix-turn-helix transcriptional regulator n=1 Tax=Pseudobutyrivibrio sp. YE44 TaxID=1520802 RepID=UPI0008812582|nr:MarR family winged helix-turn-helix transcriptional regulator [Pseudobutyrivibrio sp. YE44]SDB28034.1 DNA-binding transcriptional regulator, MarR family [Pseudobutyrivibrio sp. YE44]